MTGIKALARHLDLSIGTVSRALNDRPDVNPQTRERVIKAAREIGYRPNASGRSLRSGRTNTVGLVMETGNAGSRGGDTFFMWLIDAAQEALAEGGLDLVILPCHSADDPVEFLKRQVSHGIVDALVLSATRQNDARIAYLTEQRLPFVTLGRSGTPGNYPWIDLDFEGVAQRSLAELVALGHRRIAVAAAAGDANLAKVYLDGYRTALDAHGLPIDPELIIRVEPSEAGGVKAAQRLLALPDRPTALMLGYEVMALGVYAELARQGLSPGKDLSVIGLRDNHQLGFLNPKLASFQLDVGDLGRAVGQTVVALLGRDGSAEPGNIIWPMQYLSGDSVAPPARLPRG